MTEKPKRRWLKRLGWAFLALILLVVLNLIFPNLLIAPIARGQIESGISSAMTCQASIGSLSLDFFGLNTVGDLRLHHEGQASDEQAPVYLEHVAVGVQPMALTSDTVEITEIQVRGLHVESQLDSTGLSVMQLFGSREAPAPEPKDTPQPEPAAEPTAETAPDAAPEAAPAYGGINLEKLRIDDVNVTLYSQAMVAEKDDPTKLRQVAETLGVRGFRFHLDKVKVSGKGQLLRTVPWTMGCSFWYGSKLLGELSLSGEVANLKGNTVRASVQAELKKLDLSPYLDLQGSGTMQITAQVPMDELLLSTLEMAISIPELTISGMRSSGLSLSARADKQLAKLEAAVQDLKGGRFSLDGEINYGQDGVPWSGHIAMDDLPVMPDWFRALEHVSPIIALASLPKDIQGKLSGNVNLSSSGATFEQHLNQVEASGSVHSKDLTVRSPIFAALGALLKEDSWDPMRFIDFNQSFSIRSGYVMASDIPLVNGRTQVVLSGKTSLKSELDYSLKVAAIDGRDLSALNLGSNLIRIKGSVDGPELAAPSSIGEALGGTLENLLNNPEGLGETLEGLFGGDKDKEKPDENQEQLKEELDNALKRFGGGFFRR